MLAVAAACLRRAAAVAAAAAVPAWRRLLVRSRLLVSRQCGRQKSLGALQAVTTRQSGVTG